MGGIGGVVVQPEMENQPYGVTPVREAVSRNRTLFPVLLLAAVAARDLSLGANPEGDGSSGRSPAGGSPRALGPWPVGPASRVLRSSVRPDARTAAYSAGRVSQKWALGHARVGSPGHDVNALAPTWPGRSARAVPDTRRGERKDFVRRLARRPFEDRRPLLSPAGGPWRGRLSGAPTVASGPQPNRASQAPRAGRCSSGKRETALVLR